MSQDGPKSSSPGLEDLRDCSFQYFAVTALDLNASKKVKIRIGKEGPLYRLPKDLLCKQSPYFAGMLEGKYKEAQGQSLELDEEGQLLELDEEDEVLSHVSFQMLCQWLLTGRVNLGDMATKEAVSAIVEFLRLADMYQITSVEEYMVQQLTDTLSKDFSSETLWTNSGEEMSKRDPEAKIIHITPEHIASIVKLPRRHPLRNFIAKLLAEGYIRRKDAVFAQAIEENDELATDVLLIVKQMIASFKIQSKSNISATDPVTGERFYFMYGNSLDPAC